MRRKITKAITVFLAVITAATAFPGGVSAKEPISAENVGANTVYTDSGLTEYGEYLDANQSVKNATKKAIVSGGAFIHEASSDAYFSAEYEGKQNVLMWETGTGSVSWSINVPDAGLYLFELTFLPLKSGADIEYSLSIDGTVPFDGADQLIFTRDWINSTNEPRSDARGNEIAPEQSESGEYIYRTATDSTGVVLEPYRFALTAGEHTVTLVGNGYPVAIAEIGFSAPETIESYAQVSKDYQITEDKTVAPIVIQGEDAVIKTDNTLIAKATNDNAGMTPIDPYLTKLNNIGGGSWSSPCQKLTWSFTVETSGYYSLGTRFKQNELVNGESWRWLKIDGKTPFSEAQALRFKFSTGWQFYEFGDGDTPYYLWLEEGEHTLSLEVTLGELADFYHRLNNAVTQIGDLYLQIVMITGETPDVNRDFELFNQIPGFNDTLAEINDELAAIVEDTKNLTGKRGSNYTAAINNMRRIIQRMLDAPYIAQIYVKDYYTNYTTISSWLSEMKSMPLALDEIRLAYAGNDYDWQKTNLFKSAWFSIQRLLYSYTKGYSLDEGAEDTASLKLWINWGRDQAMVLDSLIRDSFTPETGIEVELQIVNNTLINGLLAGNYPDLQLQLTRTDPVNYGMRGALLNLREFDDCGEVLKRFQPGAEIPYSYNGALYALPDTQSYYCMFYRTDVFEQLGLTVPKTWDDFLDCATVIRRYNMNVYVPYTQITTTTTVNVGIGNLNLFPTLMLQNGLSLYNSELNATALDDVGAIKVFDEWTRMYTDYGYLKEADFYNRFRNGSMPLGIAPYNTYMTLYSAAPEIKGRWTIASIPGTAGGNNAVAGGGTGCAIVKRSSHHEEAWKFLKWWTSADTQTRYSANVESILGMLGRITTSNIEAFKNLSWDPSDMNKLLAQWDNVTEVPEVPGGYYVIRAVDQAYWAVINDNGNAKDSITKWALVADSEIERKIKEYS